MAFLHYIKARFLESVYDPFNDFFKFNIMPYKYTTAAWKIGFEFEQGLDKLFSFFVSSLLARGSELMEQNKHGILNRRVKLVTFGQVCLFLTLLLTWHVSAPALAQAEPQVSSAPAPKRVVLLYAYGDGLPAYQKATPAFLSVMEAGGINLNNLFFEYLDLQRNDSAEYRQKLADLLRYKYAKGKADLIVAVHTEALNFLLDEGKGLFPDAPVFSYLVARPELIEAKSTGRRILQRPSRMDMKGTLEIALKMFPKTRKIVFVTGTAEHRYEYEAKRDFEPWHNKLEFEYTSDRSLEEILQLVSSLPPRSIVIYFNIFSDKTGRTFIPRDVGKMVARAANAPVFCQHGWLFPALESCLGKGTWLYPR